jgi:hypothetical protein
LCFSKYIFFRARLSALLLTPNPEYQAPVFISSSFVLASPVERQAFGFSVE